MLTVAVLPLAVPHADYILDRPLAAQWYPTCGKSRNWRPCSLQASTGMHKIQQHPSNNQIKHTVHRYMYINYYVLKQRIYSEHLCVSLSHQPNIKSYSHVYLTLLPIPWSYFLTHGSKQPLQTPPLICIRGPLKLSPAYSGNSAPSPLAIRSTLYSL